MECLSVAWVLSAISLWALYSIRRHHSTFAHKSFIGIRLSGSGVRATGLGSVGFALKVLVHIGDAAVLTDVEGAPVG